MTPANPLRGTLTVTGKELAAVIMEAGANLNINQQLARDLAKLLVNTGDDTIAALQELLSQPDPHRTIKSVLRTKADEHLEDWATGDPEDLAHWIKSANLCFHAVHDLLRTMGDFRNVVTIHVIQGVRHYRESPEQHTDEQMKYFALIAAATQYSALQANAKTNLPFGSSLNSQEHLSSIKGHDHFNCCSLSSDTINDMILKHPDKTADVLNFIVNHDVHTEEPLRYFLEGGPIALVDGVL